MGKIIVLMLCTALPQFIVGQDVASFSANKIHTVDSQFYTLTSEQSKVKAKIEIRGEDSIKQNKYIFTLHFYESDSGKIKDTVSFQNALGLVTCSYPIEDYFFYESLLKNHQEKALKVVYESYANTEDNQLLITTN